MMISQVKIVAALLLAGCAFTLVAANEDLVDKTEDKDLMDKIFSVDAERISPDETLKLLIKLEKSDKSLISSLVEASRVGLSKCDNGVVDYTLIMDKTFDGQRINGTTSNGFRYMHEMRDKLFDLCYKHFSAQLNEALKATSVEELSLVSQLVDIINVKRGYEPRVPNPRFGRFWPELVGNSVLSFIQSKEGELNLSPSNDEELLGEREKLKAIMEEKFNKLVQEPCKKVSSALIDAARKLDTITRAPELLAKVSRNDWRLYHIALIANNIVTANTFERLLEAAKLN